MNRSVRSTDSIFQFSGNGPTICVERFHDQRVRPPFAVNFFSVNRDIHLTTGRMNHVKHQPIPRWLRNSSRYLSWRSKTIVKGRLHRKRNGPGMWNTLRYRTCKGSGWAAPRLRKIQTRSCSGLVLWARSVYRLETKTIEFAVEQFVLLAH